MFRARIYAQGFTLLCLVAGSYYYAEDRDKRKMFDGVKAEQRAKEKNEKWIRELEARDREDREERELRIRRLEKRTKGTDEEKGDTSLGSVRSVLERSEVRRKGPVLTAVMELMKR